MLDPASSIVLASRPTAIPNLRSTAQPYLPTTGKNILQPANLAVAAAASERIDPFLVFISTDQAFSNAGILFAVEQYQDIAN